MDAVDDPIFLATAGYETVIKLWQAHSGQLIRQLDHPGSQVNSMAVSPDRRSLAAAGYEHVRIYDIGNSSSTSACLSFDLQKNITCVGFNNSGNWLFAGGEHAVCCVWDLRTPRGGHSNQNPCTRMFRNDTPVTPITSAVLHPNQMEIFLGDTRGAIHIWDIRNNKSNSLVPDPDVRIQALSVDRAGTYLAALGNSGSCFLWSLTSSYTGLGSQAHPKYRIDAHSKYGLGCAFSPDSTLLATCGADKKCRLWKTSDYQKQVELIGADRWVWDCAFSADSQYIVTVSSDGVARLYSIENGKVPRREYKSTTRTHGHGQVSMKPMTCLAFRDDSV